MSLAEGRGRVMILGTLGVVEMALGVPHGRGGVQAAIEWLAGEVRA